MVEVMGVAYGTVAGTSIDPDIVCPIDSLPIQLCQKALMLSG